jgi:hypothetical protein
VREVPSEDDLFLVGLVGIRGWDGTFSFNRSSSKLSGETDTSFTSFTLRLNMSCTYPNLIRPKRVTEVLVAGRPKSLHRGTVELLLILQVILLGRVN